MFQIGPGKYQGWHAHPDTKFGSFQGLLCLIVADTITFGIAPAVCPLKAHLRSEVTAGRQHPS